MMSIPVQCTHEIPLTAIAHNSAAQCGADCLPRNVGTFSDLLAEDMSKLCVNVPRQRKEDGMLEQKVTPLVSMDSSRWQGASSNVSKRLWQADHPGGDRTTRTVMVGVPSVVEGSPNRFFFFYVLPQKLCVLSSRFVSDACDRQSLPGW